MAAALTRVLVDRGWSITSETCQGHDLELEVAFAGTEGLVRLRRPSPDEAPNARIANEPAFFRVDLGAPSDSPQRWGSLLRREDAAEHIDDLTVDLWFQAAAGKDMPAESLLLPPRWVTVSVRVDEAVLQGLPEGLRQQHHDGRLVWVFSDAELHGGALDNLVVRLVAALSDEGRA